MTKLEALKQNLGKKIIGCPVCQKRLRIPVKINKTLEISCPKCHVRFQIGFKSPLLELFKWEKGRSFKFNLKSFSYRFTLLPLSTKFILSIMMFLAFLMLGTLIEWGMSLTQSL